jgi:CTP:molybdopterin cytidylyltransferase MocA/molybdenum-dependent DNA-binding transcriptional regulator ModE
MTLAALVVEVAGFNPTVAVAGDRAVRRLVLTFQLAGIKRVVIAADMYARDIEKRCSRLGAEFLRPGEGDGAVFTAGLRYLGGKYDRVMVVPANFPMFDIETVRRLAETRAAVVAPTFGGALGWPVVLSSERLGEVADRPDGIAAFLASIADDILRLPVPDPGVTLDALTADEAALAAVASDRTLRRLRPGVRPALSREFPFFGPGIAQFLRLIDETDNAQKAYTMLAMARSHAYGLVGRLRDNLGFEPFETQVGVGTGFTRLTPECRDFLDKYERYARAVETFADEEFERVFGAGE